jgi:hypothetical protein
MISIHWIALWLIISVSALVGYLLAILLLASTKGEHDA